MTTRLLTAALAALLATIAAACSGGKAPMVLPPLQTRVTATLFASGAAPNDIALGNGFIYIANSLDNTLKAYAPSGVESGSHTFAQGVSPAFVMADAGTVWAVSNGDNTLTGLNPTLDAVTIGPVALPELTSAFVGPVGAVLSDTHLFVPRNEIATFGPTIYGTGLITRMNQDGTEGVNFPTIGRNPQVAVFDGASDRLYVVTAGEIQFDQNFIPHVETDSFVEAYDTSNAAAGLPLIGSANLGPVGANCIALDPGGQSAYVGNSLSGSIYKVQLPGLSIERGQANPIALTTQFTFVSDLKFTPDGQYLLATSFNTDELYVIDPVTDTVSPAPYTAPFDLNPDDVLAGALRMAVGPAAVPDSSARVYVVMSVANSVAAVDLY